MTEENALVERDGLGEVAAFFGSFAEEVEALGGGFAAPFLGGGDAREDGLGFVEAVEGEQGAGFEEGGFGARRAAPFSIASRAQPSARVASPARRAISPRPVMATSRKADWG